MTTLLTGLMFALIIGAILILIAFIVFGGMEGLISRFPNIETFLTNMFNDEK